MVVAGIRVFAESRLKVVVDRDLQYRSRVGSYCF
jgi:hypothetical protein